MNRNHNFFIYKTEIVEEYIFTRTENDFIVFLCICFCLQKTTYLPKIRAMIIFKCGNWNSSINCTVFKLPTENWQNLIVKALHINGILIKVFLNITVVFIKYSKTKKYV